MKGEQCYYKLVNNSPKRHVFTSWLQANACTVLYIIQFYLQYIFIIIKKYIKTLSLHFKLKLYFNVEGYS